jgi:hypothetical protein
VYNSYSYIIEDDIPNRSHFKIIKGLLGFGVMGFWAAPPSKDSQLTQWALAPKGAFKLAIVDCKVSAFTLRFLRVCTSAMI